MTARGVYRELLDAQWDMGTLPAEPTDLQRVIGATSQEWTEGWGRCASKFEPVSGGLRNPRLEEHRADSLKRREARVEAARKTNAGRQAKRDGDRDGDRDGGRAQTVTVTDTSTATSSTPASPSAEAPIPFKKAASGQSTPSKARRARRPADFILTPDLRGYIDGQLPQADHDQLFDKFCEQADAKGWEYVDWPKAFQTYCRNAKPDSGHFSAGNYPRRQLIDSLDPTAHLVMR